MGKRGRPPKSPNERKGKLIAFRVEPDDASQIDSAIAQSGLNQSEWIRDRLVRAAIRELKKTQPKQ